MIKREKKFLLEWNTKMIKINYKDIKHLFIAPMIAFFMIMFWAALFGNSIGEEKSMFEEWFVCMGIYLCAVVSFRLLKK